MELWVVEIGRWAPSYTEPEPDGWKIGIDERGIPLVYLIKSQAESRVVELTNNHLRFGSIPGPLIRVVKYTKETS